MDRHEAEWSDRYRQSVVIERRQQISSFEINSRGVVVGPERRKGPTYHPEPYWKINKLYVISVPRRTMYLSLGRNKNYTYHTYSILEAEPNFDYLIQLQIQLMK